MVVTAHKGILFCFWIFMGWALLMGCRKESSFVRTGTTLQFSADTIFLDTVFTGIGSSTRQLRVFNPTTENLIIDRIFLGKGPQSAFRMNVNGQSTKDARDVEILARDSIYIFIETTADAQGNLELLHTDSIIFLTGNRSQHVNLVTLALDAYFHYPDSVLRISQDPFPDLLLPYSFASCNTTWRADKPHVVYGYVVVPDQCVLTIDPGTQIHFHNNSGLWVANGGSLQVDPAGMGDYETPVVFQGDRLEPFYKEIPGQWGGLLGGIFFQGNSVNNVMRNAIVKNATIGIRLDSNAAATPNVLLSNVRVYNHSRVGLYGGFGNLEAENMVLANCGLYTFFALGGSYAFRHTTFANYWNQSSRGTPAIGLTNFFEFDRQIFVRELTKAYFGNCIVFGSNESEFGVARAPQGRLDYQFVNALLKINPQPDDNSYDLNNPANFMDVIINRAPLFANVTENNYQLDSASAAINMGNTTDGIRIPLDIRGQLRSFGGLPDLGAYERTQ
jgi:hypothetical protein